MLIANPVQDVLHIKLEASIERIEIYNMAGQRIKVLETQERTVSDLAKGMYLMTPTTDKGTVTEKIIKE
ncbi:T9SS type A sorting domain-containing protein [Capnocytophaga sp. ARDL2]|uniref:T9SS type A sorting domain-containing protein n=1 Tax=Capnocytophaga sp. ARDL2 TaxID=3238809 RepID=UPI003557CD54